MKARIVLYALVALTTACSKHAVKQPTAACQCPEPIAIERPADAGKTDSKPSDTAKPEPAKSVDFALLKPAKWQEMEGWSNDDLLTAWPAWLQSCSVLAKREQWQSACNAALAIKKPSKWAIQHYFTKHFDVYGAYQEDGRDTGMITGYYQPLLKGSRQKSALYAYPLYKQPNDLITVELAELYPELKYKRVRGKLVGNKLVPYSTRAEIDKNETMLSGSEIVWVDDIVDAFFLQVQGSGLIQLDNDEQIQVGYADQNGHPYNSVGRLLVERGELTLDQASMQGIKNWAKAHPDKLRDLLNQNPSYVFFRELPKGLPGPLGALGVPITGGRSVAVDPKYIPLGAPIFLSTTEPNQNTPLRRLMMAQDTGGAIKGGVRADFFWGAGAEAGEKAGAMKQNGKIWVLLPKGFFNK